VLVIGHLRAEKDPFRVALATAYLPEDSQIQVMHWAAPSPKTWLKRGAGADQAPRWHWLAMYRTRR